MKTKQTEIDKALNDGNYVRALSLKGCSIKQVYYRKNGKQECNLLIHSDQGYEGRFGSTCEAWKAIYQ